MVPPDHHSNYVNYRVKRAVKKSTESYFSDLCIICNVYVMEPVLTIIKHDNMYINMFALV